MKILAIGDVVGKRAVDHLQKKLWDIRKELKADFTVVNGENASDIYGIDENEANAILSAGADVITLGNHAFGRKNIFAMLSESESTTSVSIFSMCMARRSAVRRPMPGRRWSSEHTSSSSLDMAQTI